MIVYGRNPVREALRGRRRDAVSRIVVTEATAQEPWLHGLVVEVASAAEVQELCGSREHQGICAEAGPYPYADAAQLLAAPEPLVVALDELQDPHNLGAICRSAECAGATGVVICERRAVEVTPAVCKASAGAVEHLPVARVHNLVKFLEQAKEASCWCYGAAAGADVGYGEPDYRGGVVLVLGAEGRGLRRLVAERCDATVSLPLHGQISSLNVSATAAVLLYEVLQRREALDRGT